MAKKFRIWSNKKIFLNEPVREKQVAKPTLTKYNPPGPLNLLLSKKDGMNFLDLRKKKIHDWELILKLL